MAQLISVDPVLPGATARIASSDYFARTFGFEKFSNLVAIAPCTPSNAIVLLSDWKESAIFEPTVK
jgi:hypothetical protein